MSPIKGGISAKNLEGSWRHCLAGSSLWRVGCWWLCVQLSTCVPPSTPIHLPRRVSSVQFSSSSCLTLCYPMDCIMPGLPVHHKLLEFPQTHVHWVSDAIQPSHPLSSPSPPTFSISQHQSLFKWVSSLHQMAKALEFQSQHQPFQWTFRTDFL